MTHIRCAVLLAVAMAGSVLATPLDAGEGLDKAQTVTLDFKGGTVQEYVEQIRKACNADVNVVMDEEARKIRLSPVMLEALPWREAVRSISTLSGGRAYVQGDRQGRREEDPAVAEVFNVIAVQQAGLRIDVLSLRPLLQDPSAKPEDAITLKPEAVLTAMETALNLGKKEGDGEKDAVLKYHPDSGLLFVNGSERQHEVLQQVLRTLEGDLLRERNRRDGRAEPEGDVER